MGQFASAGGGKGRVPPQASFGGAVAAPGSAQTATAQPALQPMPVAGPSGSGVANASVGQLMVPAPKPAMIGAAPPGASGGVDPRIMQMMASIAANRNATPNAPITQQLMANRAALAPQPQTIGPTMAGGIQRTNPNAAPTVDPRLMAHMLRGG